MVTHCSGLRDREGLVEEAVSTLLTTLDLDEVLTRAADLLRRHFGGTRVAIHRYRAEAPGEAEVLWVNDPRNPDARAGVRFALAGTATGEAIATRQPVTIDHVISLGAGFGEAEPLRRAGYGAMAVFPLLADTEVLGALEIAHLAEDGLLCRCFQPARMIAQLVAIALHNSLMVAEVQRLNGLLSQENSYLKDQVRDVRADFLAETRSPAMAAALEKVRLVAPSETTVLIRGETGTGKEGLAHRVHAQSPRASGPFVAVNLGAIPEALIESELFGHERGAFTGAVRRKIGRFEQASGGTLLLDEVGDAPPAVQVKLLRALQEREIHRVGGEAAVPVDVRCIAATNRPLEALVEEGRFRSDLYYRLNIFPIELPPLRHRREDLGALVEHLLVRHARRMNRRLPRVPETMLRALEAHPWPGNVRELENLLERALILSPGDTLALPDLGAPPPPSGPVRKAGEAEVLPFEQAMRVLLEQALAASGGRIYGPGGAAARLGLKPTTMQGKLKRYGVSADGFSAT